MHAGSHYERIRDSESTRLGECHHEDRRDIVKFLDPNRFKGLACRTSQTSFPNILRVGVSDFRAYCMVGLHWQVNCAHTDGLCDCRLAIAHLVRAGWTVIYPPGCCCTSGLLKRKCRHNHDYAVLLVVPVELTTTRRSSAPLQAFESLTLSAIAHTPSPRASGCS